MKKNKLDNDVNDCIGVVYAENEVELTLLIQNGAVYEEKEIGQ